LRFSFTTLRLDFFADVLYLFQSSAGAGRTENAKSGGDDMCGRYGGPKALEVYAGFLPVDPPFEALTLQPEYAIGQMAPVYARNRDGQVVV
jgi:hypothetical protein